MTVGIVEMEEALTTDSEVDELIEVVLRNSVVLDKEFNKGVFVGITLVSAVLVPETGIFTDEVLKDDVAVYVSVTGDTKVTLAVCNVVAGTVTLTMRGNSLEDVELDAELGPETDVWGEAFEPRVPLFMDVDNKESVIPLEEINEETVSEGLAADVIVVKPAVEDEVELVDMVEMKELERGEGVINEDAWVVKDVVVSGIFGTIIVVAKVDEASVSVVVSAGWTGTGDAPSCDGVVVTVVFSNLLWTLLSN